MPITFDTLEELISFYQTFRLNDRMEKAAPAAAKQFADSEQLPARQRQPRSTRQTALEMPQAPKRPGRRPKLEQAEPVKARPRRERGNTLTARIQNAIQNFLDKNNSFTANDIYDIIVKKDPSINKQSVITSVLKQMNSTYNYVSVTEREGRGPRPVKLYNA